LPSDVKFALRMTFGDGGTFVITPVEGGRIPSLSFSVTGSSVFVISRYAWIKSCVKVPGFGGQIPKLQNFFTHFTLL